MENQEKALLAVTPAIDPNEPLLESSNGRYTGITRATASEMLGIQVFSDEHGHAIVKPLEQIWGKVGSYNMAVVLHQEPFALLEGAIGNLYKPREWGLLLRGTKVDNREYLNRINSHSLMFKDVPDADFRQFSLRHRSWAFPQGSLPATQLTDAVWWCNEHSVIGGNENQATAASGGTPVKIKNFPDLLANVLLRQPMDLTTGTESLLSVAPVDVYPIVDEGPKKSRGTVLYLAGYNEYQQIFSVVVYTLDLLNRIKQLGFDVLIRASAVKKQTDWEVLVRTGVNAITYNNKGEEVWLNYDQVLNRLAKKQKDLKKVCNAQELTHGDLTRGYYKLVPGSNLTIEGRHSTFRNDLEDLPKVTVGVKSSGQQNADWVLGKQNGVAVLANKSLYPSVGVQGKSGHGKTTYTKNNLLHLYGPEFMVAPCGEAPMDPWSDFGRSLGGLVFPGDYELFADVIAQVVDGGIDALSYDDFIYDGTEDTNADTIKRQRANHVTHNMVIDAVMKHVYKEWISNGSMTKLPIILDPAGVGEVLWTSMVYKYIFSWGWMIGEWGKGHPEIRTALAVDNVSGIPSEQNDLNLGKLPYQMGSNLRELLYKVINQWRNRRVDSWFLVHQEEDWNYVKKGMRDALTMLVVPHSPKEKHFSTRRLVDYFEPEGKGLIPFLKNVDVTIEGKLLTMLDQE
jgi:hypothetical protein